MVDVILSAISPGINNPQIAILSIKKIGVFSMISAFSSVKYKKLIIIFHIKFIVSKMICLQFMPI